MPVDTTNLNAAIAATVAEATRAEAGGDSIIALLQGFAAAINTAVAAALKADAAANQASIDAAAQAIQSVTARFTAEDDKIAAAIAANPLPGSTPPARK